MSFATNFPGTLEAISLGAVFFGAMTYVGNGPNFMVKAIAEHSRVATPGFVGYITRYAIPILVPFLALVGLMFFSRWRIFG
jgi:Na+/H+ antiporter NhaD/arsenite permease-like protein